MQPSDVNSPTAAPSGPEPIVMYNRIKDCRHGRMVYNVNDLYVGRSFDLYGEFSEGEVDLFRRIVRPADVVIEVGANIGAHTVFLARAAYSGAVFAFEPQRLVYQTLCANLAVNSLLNVFASQLAVGETRGVVPVPEADPRQPFNFGGIGLENVSEGIPVQMVCLDDLPLGECRFVKIDVEGMEAIVLRGARQMIERFRPILYVEADRKDRQLALTALIRELGYVPYWHAPPLFNPYNFARNPENVFDTKVSLNALCLPKESGEKELATGLEPVA